MSDHQFLRYKISGPVPKRTREVALELTNFYFKSTLSKSKLEKLPPKIVPWVVFNQDRSVKSNHVSLPIHITTIEKSILASGFFQSKEFGIYGPKCEWLDGVVDVAPAFHIFDGNGDVLKFRSQLPFGKDFPLYPQIDREGRTVSSFQIPIQKRIYKLRNDLVAKSSEFHSDEWLYDLLAIISSCVSVIEITLHQLYVKAEYDPLPGWKFEKEKIGEKNTGRLKEKFDWVKHITGKPLDTVYLEMKAFNTLREIRNHTQHFDPPCFGFAMEEVAEWLNHVIAVSRLEWEIRKRLGSPLNEELIKLLLLPEVEFVPADPAKPRKQLENDCGYISTCWKEDGLSSA